MSRNSLSVRLMLLVLVILISIPIQGFAQNYEEGFIIRNSGDTLSGFINYRSFVQDVVNFKTSFSDESTTYGPTDIAAFGYKEGRFYKSEILAIDNKTTPSFYENLVVGELSLLKDSRSYIMRKGDKVGRLLAAATSGKTTKDRVLVRQVSGFLSGCNKTLIENVGFKFNERKLVEITLAYNDCIGSDSIEYNKYLPWIKVETTALIGLNQSKLSFSNNIDYPVIDLADFSSVKSVFPGIEFYFKSPRLDKNAAFILGLHYQLTDYYGFASIGSSQSGFHSDFIVERSFFRIPVGVSYTLPWFGVPVNIKGGGQFLISASFNQQRIEYRIVTTTSQQNISTITEHQNEFEGKSGMAGFWFGLGTEFSLTEKLDLTLDLRNERISGSTNLSSNTNNIQLLIGVKL